MDAQGELDELRRQYEAVVVERDAAVVERDELSGRVSQLTRRYDGLLHEYDKLKKSLLGPKRESVRANEAQLTLLGVLEALGRLQGGDDSAGDDAQDALARARELLKGHTKQPKKRNKHGRRKLSLEDLPVHRLVIEPPERLAPGGERLKRVGEEVTEYVEHTPASKVRMQIVRPKYVDPDVVRRSEEPSVVGAPLSAAARPKRFVIAELPQLPVPRCLAGPGLLAHSLVSKYGDHIPMHRQERIFKREGLSVSRSTLCDWARASTDLLSRVVEAMHTDARDNASYVLTDATGVLVLDKDRCRRGHFYVVIAPKQHVLFRFTTKNDGDTVAKLLKGFSGHIHADASSVYHELYANEDLVEVGCWAHARRKFFEALATDPERALTGIGFISRLYDAQRATWNVKTGVADADKRAELARPVLRPFLRWVGAQLDVVTEHTPISRALGYVRNQLRPLLRFLKDGRLRLDNNPAELELRRLVIGRKNWMFAGSDYGAEWAATAVSLIASCDMHDIEPWAYLRDVLTLLPEWDQTKVLQLSPKHWPETAARPQTQALLDELDLFRRAERQPPAQATPPE